MTNEPSEAERIERARKGDRRAVEWLYRTYSARVYAVVRRLAGNDALAEEWAQDAWVRVIRALPEFRGDALFSTWLHRVAVNSALQGKRSHGRRAGREAPLLAPIGVQPDASRNLLRMRLERAIDALPDRMRQVLVLHDIEGYTHSEIGDLMNIADGTSKSQLSRARARMRELLAGAAKTEDKEEACHI